MDLLARALVGCAVALACTPAGISGAFLLLPAQLHLFGVPSPAISATNLVYNVIATPAGAATFDRRGGLDRRLALWLVVGTTPGVIIGVLLRSSWLASESSFDWIAAPVLIAIGLRLILARDRDTDSGDIGKLVPTWRLFAIGSLGGTIGGIYGFGGAAIIVPYLVSVERLPVRRVAGAGLITTFVTSLVGLGAFATAAQLGIGQARPPDWPAGIAFGIGGAIGAIAGARLQPHIPVPLLKVTLGILAVIAGIRTAL